MKKFALFDDQIQIAISELSDGNMRAFNSSEQKKVIQNQITLGSPLELPSKSIARLKTVYENRDNFTIYKTVTRKNLPTFRIENSESQIPDSDGLITGQKQLGLLLPLADCLGMVVFDPVQQSLGLLHAGRHNIEQEGVAKFIAYFCNKSRSNPEDLLIYFSPRAQNYQISALNQQKLPDAASQQLLASGVRSDNITRSEIDTVSDANFPSCSNGDRQTRFAILVMLK